MEQREIIRLYESYGNDVYRLALSMLGNRADAEDICQSVFLRLTDKKTVLYPGKEKAWLLTCAANACKNQLKSFWRRRSEPDESLPAREEDRALWRAVMSLPSKYRAVVHLYYYEGYSQGEIAEILKISRTAVQTRMARARDMLKKELSEE
ncbi:MAG: sigma-70 family RNA polymerase sigma factor [Oscillospiraceae bacterium]|nr:sigma-70 family RNA polymerase sigma factor [Oscillospiraceae bacterium]